MATKEKASPGRRACRSRKILTLGDLRAEQVRIYNMALKSEISETRLSALGQQLTRVGTTIKDMEQIAAITDLDQKLNELMQEGE